MSPFDLKAALLAKHAQHVVLIHFPIALFMASVFFDLLARWRRDKTMAAAAYFNLLGAAVTVGPTIVTGLLAWQLLLEGERPRGNLRLHMILAISSSVLIWILTWWRVRAANVSERSVAGRYVTVELAAVVLIALTAHLGGILSGVELPPA
ncbi:MAG TPA: DUF2231 domain-containing protein [Terriglobia bacterium]|nr:DUF2231 domain-containing protein [Terriglobia bacterium]